MKTSELVTSIVAKFAIPWAHHMKYLLGRSNETNWVGSSVHFVGYPICNLAGRIYFGYNYFRTVFMPRGILLASPLLPLIITLLLILILSPNLSLSTSSERLNILQCLFLLYTLISTSKKVFRKGLYYFKAIGRST